MENQNVPVTEFEEDAWVELDKKLGREYSENNTDLGVNEKDDRIQDLLNGKEPRDDENEIESSDNAEQKEPEQSEPLDEVGSGVSETNEETGEAGEHDTESGHSGDDSTGDSDFYANTVKMPFGMPEMTVGEMKDVVVELSRHQAESEKIRNDGIASREFAKDLISVMGELPPNAQQMIREYVEKDVRQQTELLLERIPEWNDNVTYTRESQEIAKVASDYGISDYEFSAIRDNRHIRILRDLTKAKAEQTLLKDRLKEMQKQVDANKRQERSKGKKTMAKRQIQDNAQKKIAELVKAGRKLDAIDTLIKG